MNIVPANIEQQINRVDRQRSLWIGISLAVLAAGSFFRLLWMLYISMTFGWFAAGMAFNVVFSAVVGVVAAVGATGFLTRYYKGADADRV
jgi:amino acid permease